MERKIKNTGFKVSHNEKFLNPNTLEIHQNMDDEPVCSSKYYLSHNNILKFVKQKCTNNISKDDAHKFMLYPYTVLNSSELLKIYKINNIEELFETIKDLIIFKHNFETINRILNACIKNNFEEFKTKNQLLVKIYIYLINSYHPNININNDNIEKFIKKWFNNNNYDNFNLNLGEEIIKYLL